MKPQALLLGWLLLASLRLAAQTELGVDPCELDPSLTLQRARSAGSTDPDLGWCRDTSTDLDSALTGVYRRALARFADPVKRQALEQSEAAFAGYVTTQQKLLGAIGGDSVHVRRTMIRYRVFFLQKMLGEWTEMDEEAARVTMRADLRDLVTAEEAFYADSVRYTARLSALDFRPSPLNKIVAFRLTRDGWAATVGNAKTSTECSIFIGTTTIAPATKEGEPACR